MIGPHKFYLTFLVIGPHKFYLTFLVIGPRKYYLILPAIDLQILLRYVNVNVNEM